MFQIRADEFKARHEDTWSDRKGVNHERYQEFRKVHEYFGDIECESLTQEMKDQVLPLLMLTVMKRSCDLKTRGCIQVSLQRSHTNESECSYLTTDF